MDLMFPVSRRMNEQNLKMIVDFLNQEINDNRSTPASFEVFMKLFGIEKQRD